MKRETETLAATQAAEHQQFVEAVTKAAALNDAALPRDMLKHRYKASKELVNLRSDVRTAKDSTWRQCGKGSEHGKCPSCRHGEWRPAESPESAGAIPPRPPPLLPPAALSPVSRLIPIHPLHASPGRSRGWRRWGGGAWSRSTRRERRRWRRRRWRHGRRSSCDRRSSPNAASVPKPTFRPAPSASPSASPPPLICLAVVEFGGRATSPPVHASNTSPCTAC